MARTGSSLVNLSICHLAKQQASVCLFPSLRQVGTVQELESAIVSSGRVSCKWHQWHNSQVLWITTSFTAVSWEPRSWSAAPDSAASALRSQAATAWEFPDLSVERPWAPKIWSFPMFSPKSAEVWESDYTTRRWAVCDLCFSLVFLKRYEHKLQVTSAFVKLALCNQGSLQWAS